MATIEGAKALGMDGEIGTPAPGRRADIITMRVDDLVPAPAPSPIETVDFRFGSSHIDTVLVDSKPSYVTENW